MGARKAKAKTATEAPVSPQAPLAVRARGVLGILGNKPRLLVSIAGAFWTIGVLAMRLDASYSPLVVGLFAIAGFFSIWWVFKELTISDRKIVGTLAVYTLAALLLASSASWWISTAPIFKTITLQALTLFEPGKPPKQHDLGGNVFLRRVWLPTVPIKLVPDQAYTFHFLVVHNEPGSTITGELWIYPSDGIEIEKNQGWGAVLHGDSTHHHFIEFESVTHDRPPMLRAFSLKGKRAGWFPIRYEIHAIATDANGQKTPAGIVAGHFMVRFY